MNKKIIWQLPTHQSDVTNLDWIHPKAKFHAYDENCKSLCKIHCQAPYFEQYDFNKTLEEYGENAFCKKCLKKYFELMKKKIRVPKVGEKFHFFDDGKSSPSRHYIVTITDVKNFDDLSETLQNEIKEEQKQCYWLYAKETDYVLKGVLNDSEIEPLYFIRTTDGEWFSIGSWGGELDIDGSKFKEIIDDEFVFYNCKTLNEAKYIYNKQSGLTEEDLKGVIEND